MKFETKPPKIRNTDELIAIIPKEEWIILDVLRGIVKERLPHYCKEKISFGVPFFYGHKGICILWPASVPRGGIKEGVLLGFWQGNKLSDPENYLTKGTNKKVYYKIFKTPEAINIASIQKLIDEAVRVDQYI